MATATITFAPEEAQYLASAFPALIKNNGTNSPVSGLAFDAATEEKAYYKFKATGYASGNPTLTISWYADSATSGVVRWGCRLAAITSNTDSQDVETDGFATQQTADDTHLGTTGQRLHTIDVTISNLDSLTAGDDCVLEISRVANHANDTMTGDALMTLAVLTYTT
jgi:hypothetical protein